MRVLICGGRDFDSGKVWYWLEHCMRAEVGFIGAFHVECIIHGGAKGADSAAARWAESEGIKVLAFSADWKKHGKAAGPIRNRRMIVDGSPDVVIAFPGGKGTANMVKLAEEYGIRVIHAE